VKPRASWLRSWRDWRDDLEDDHGDELDAPHVWRSAGNGELRADAPGPEREHPAVRSARARLFESLRARREARGVQRVPLGRRVVRALRALLARWRAS
jgi:hypothetical protein